MAGLEKTAEVWQKQGQVGPQQILQSRESAPEQAFSFLFQLSKALKDGRICTGGVSILEITPPVFCIQKADFSLYSIAGNFIDNMLKFLNDFLQTPSKLPKIIAIIGPTASGKTSLSISLAKFLKTEIISADSRQIYREMNIGTGKVTKAETQGIPHHLIDIINPDEIYNLQKFQSDAKNLINSLHKQNKIPILVGGTGLYISSILDNYNLPTAKPNESLRKELETLAAEKGNIAVHQKLNLLNPKLATSIHPENLRFIIRAIEKISQTKPQNPKSPPEYQQLIINLNWPRQTLYTLIENRIDQMIERGLIEETAFLQTKYPPSLPSMSSLGYRELSLYLLGTTDLQTAVDKFKQHTRNFAKRQLTWFRRYKPTSTPNLINLDGQSILEFKNELDNLQ